MTGQVLRMRAPCVLFLAYLALVVALQRDFSRMHLQLGGVPIFTGEAAIGLFCLLELVSIARARALPFRPRIEDWMVVAFMGAGVVFVVVGLARGFGLAAIRDFALVYYAAFYFLARALLARTGSSEAIVTALVAGAIAGATFHSVRFLAAPRLTWEHGAPPGVALIGWIGLVGIVLVWPQTDSSARRTLLGLSVLPCSFAIYLSAYRTVGIVILGSLGVAALLAVVQRSLLCRRVVLLGAAWCLLFVSAIGAHSLLLSAEGGHLPQDGPTTLRAGTNVITWRWVSPLLKLADDRSASSIAATSALSPLQVSALRERNIGTLSSPQGSYGSADFRLLTWRHALERIRHAPLTGIGFGPPAALFPDYHCELASSPLSNCGNAHNTYLTVAMRMGLPVLALLLVLNGVIVARALPPPGERERAARIFLLISWTASAGYALLSLFLESPYLSTPYWIVLAGLAFVGRAPAGGRTDARPIVAETL